LGTHGLRLCREPSLSIARLLNQSGPVAMSVLCRKHEEGAM
jgi:hypothetical protein